ncbi:hypothetical protein [Streptomyces kanasensis]
MYDVAVFVTKFHRHSSQNGAIASRGVRHCGHSSACCVALGSPPAGPG